ncbi:hypothetical protein RS030_243578 [Cryptosporidium xiaoi]|uniref:Uncharacterized protein n=1 Tax=Cryptosporidium xiaoi TaxID=659607 RepID=A0AAV9XX42_9CRYT
MENDLKKPVNNDSSLIIDSLRNQIKRIPTFSKYRVLKPNINERNQIYNNENEFNNANNDTNESSNKISSVAEQIRNTVLTCYSSCKENVYDNNLNYELNNGSDAFSPFHKKHKVTENTYFRDKISEYNQLKMDENELCMYKINKLRNEMIKLNKKNTYNKYENSNAIKLIPNIYTPLSPMELLNLKELTLILSILYSNDAEKDFFSYYFSDNDEDKNNVNFFYPEKLSITQYSTVITGKITHKLDDNFVFSYNNSQQCKFILSNSK